MKFNHNFKFEKLFLTSFYENPDIFTNKIKEKLRFTLQKEKKFLSSKQSKAFPLKRPFPGFINEKKLNFNKSRKLNIKLKNLTKQSFFNSMTYKIISKKKKFLKKKISWVWSQNFQIYNNINNKSLFLKENKFKKIPDRFKLGQNLSHKLKTTSYSIQNLLKINKRKLLLFSSSKKNDNYQISNNIHKIYFFKNHLFHFQTCCLKKNKFNLNKLLFFIDFFIIETQLKIIKFEKNNCFQNQFKLKKLYFKNYFFYFIFIPFTSLFYKVSSLLIEKPLSKIGKEKFYFQLEEFIDLLKNSKNHELKAVTLSAKNLFSNQMKEILKIFSPSVINQSFCSIHQVKRNFSLIIQKEKIKKSKKFFAFFQNQNDVLHFVIRQFLIRNLFYFFSLSSPSFSIYPITKSPSEFSFLSPKSWGVSSEMDFIEISSQKRILESKNYFLFSKIFPINNWNKFHLISFFQQGPQYNCQSSHQNLIQEIFLIFNRNEKIWIQTYSFIFKELFQNSIGNIFRKKILLKNNNFNKKHLFLLKLSKNHLFFQNMQIDIYEKYIEESIFNIIGKKIVKFQSQLWLKKHSINSFATQSQAFPYIQKNNNLEIFREFKENLVFKKINYTFISTKNRFLFGSEKLWDSFIFCGYFDKYFKKYELLKKYQKFYFSHSFLSFKNQKNGLDFLGFNFKHFKEEKKNSVFISRLIKTDSNKFILIKKNCLKKPIFRKDKLLKIIFQLDFFLNLIENLSLSISNFCQINFQKNLENRTKEKKEYCVRKFIYFNKQKIFLNSFFLFKFQKKILMNNFFYKIDFYFTIESILLEEFFSFKLIILPSKENIRLHFQKIKNIIKKSKSQPQEYLINKLSDNIKIWSFNYKMIFQVFFNQKKNDQISKLLSYCDYITFKYVWNWACQRHPNKSKKWIKEKYFNYVENKKWIFSAFNLSTKSLLILRKH